MPLRDANPEDFDAILMPKLTRAHTFGSPSLHWIKVTVRTRSAPVCTVHPVTVPQR